LFPRSCSLVTDQQVLKENWSPLPEKEQSEFLDVECKLGALESIDLGASTP
jgi:hypothetical protein